LTIHFIGADAQEARGTKFSADSKKQLRAPPRGDIDILSAQTRNRFLKNKDVV